MARRSTVQTDVETQEPAQLAPKPLTRKRIAADNERLIVPISTTGPTVTVACKLPHGIEMMLYRMETFSEPVMGGGVREGKRAVPLIQTKQLINGFANEVDKRPKSLVYGGFAMTYGVSKDVYDQWIEDNRDSDIVQKKLIFAVEGDHEDAHQEAVDLRPLISGFEPIDPKKPMIVNGIKVEARAE